MTCDVCSGAIPDGVKVEGHTALCAQVVSEECQRLREHVARLHESLTETKNELRTFAATYESEPTWEIVKRASFVLAEPVSPKRREETEP